MSKNFHVSTRAAPGGTTRSGCPSRPAIASAVRPIAPPGSGVLQRLGIQRGSGRGGSLDIARTGASCMDQPPFAAPEPASAWARPVEPAAIEPAPAAQPAAAEPVDLEPIAIEPAPIQATPPSSRRPAPIQPRPANGSSPDGRPRRSSRQPPLPGHTPTCRRPTTRRGRPYVPGGPAGPDWSSSRPRFRPCLRRG